MAEDQLYFIVKYSLFSIICYVHTEKGESM